MARFRAGETPAFTTLVQRYERELYGYLRRYVGDGSLAEDVFQNTFLQVYLKSGQYETGRRVRPGSCTPSPRTRPWTPCAQRPPPGGQSGAGPRNHPDGEADNLAAALEGRDPCPFEAAAGLEQAERVRAAVARLPDFLRQVLLLAYYQGLKYREVAEILDIPVGTVKSRLHAALVRLQELMTPSAAVSEA